MKSIKVMMTLMMCLMTTVSFSQSDFTWSAKGDVDKTKEEIYSDIKQFIGKTWKSPDDITKNDDKTSGVILVRALTSTHYIYFRGATYAYTYQYEMTFKMRDSMYFIELASVRCHSTAKSSFNNNPMIEPHEQENCEYPDTKLGKKWHDECNILMNSLKSELQLLFDASNISVNEKNVDDW